jgi:hypothetical protein
MAEALEVFGSQLLMARNPGLQHKVQLDDLLKGICSLR